MYIYIPNKRVQTTITDANFSVQIPVNPLKLSNRNCNAAQIWPFTASVKLLLKRSSLDVLTLHTLMLFASW